MPFGGDYEVRQRSDKCGVGLISDALPFGRLWYGEPNAASNAVDYAKFRSRSHDAVIRVYDETNNVIGTLKPDQFSNDERSAREPRSDDDIAKPSVPAPNTIDSHDSNTTARGCSKGGRRFQ
jgi:hypothetical protein